MDMFEKASKMKLRFSSQQGNLTVEDLWDLPLNSENRVSLNSVAREIYKALQDNEEMDFVKTKAPTNTALELRMEIVKHIIEVRVAENAAKSLEVAKKAQKEKIMEIMASKQDEELHKLSVEELKKLLES